MDFEGAKNNYSQWNIWKYRTGLGIRRAFERGWASSKDGQRFTGFAEKLSVKGFSTDNWEYFKYPIIYHSWFHQMVTLHQNQVWFCHGHELRNTSTTRKTVHHAFNKCKLKLYCVRRYINLNTSIFPGPKLFYIYFISFTTTWLHSSLSLGTELSCLQHKLLTN